MTGKSQVNRMAMAGIKAYQRRAEQAEAELAECREALEWALDIIELDERLIATELPEAWATIDHEANRAAHIKASRNLLEKPGP